jgi:hypothetical protein
MGGGGAGCAWGRGCGETGALGGARASALPDLLPFFVTLFLLFFFSLLPAQARGYGRVALSKCVNGGARTGAWAVERAHTTPPPLSPPSPQPPSHFFFSLFPFSNQKPVRLHAHPAGAPLCRLRRGRGRPGPGHPHPLPVRARELLVPAGGRQGSGERAVRLVKGGGEGNVFCFFVFFVFIGRPGVPGAVLSRGVGRCFRWGRWGAGTGGGNGAGVGGEVGGGGWACDGKMR